MLKNLWTLNTVECKFIIYIVLTFCCCKHIASSGVFYSEVTINGKISREKFEPELILEPWTSRFLAWQLNQDSSMVEYQARDLEVRVPVQVQIFLLKSDKLYSISEISCIINNSRESFWVLSQWFMWLLPMMLFCPSWSCTLIYCIIRFTSLCKNFSLTCVFSRSFSMPCASFSMLGGSAVIVTHWKWRT